MSPSPSQSSSASASTPDISVSSGQNPLTGAYQLQWHVGNDSFSISASGAQEVRAYLAGHQWDRGISEVYGSLIDKLDQDQPKHSEVDGLKVIQPPMAKHFPHGGGTHRQSGTKHPHGGGGKRHSHSTPQSRTSASEPQREAASPPAQTNPQDGKPANTERAAVSKPDAPKPDAPKPEAHETGAGPHSPGMGQKILNAFGRLPAASDAADAFDRRAEEARAGADYLKGEVNDWMRDTDDSWPEERAVKWLIGTGVKNALTGASLATHVTSGFADTLRFGQGIAEGGFWGFAKDALRAVDIVSGADTVLTKGVDAARRAGTFLKGVGAGGEGAAFGARANSVATSTKGPRNFAMRFMKNSQTGEIDLAAVKQHVANLASLPSNIHQGRFLANLDRAIQAGLAVSTKTQLRMANGQIVKLGKAAGKFVWNSTRRGADISAVNGDVIMLDGAMREADFYKVLMHETEHFAHFQSDVGLFMRSIKLGRVAIARGVSGAAIVQYGEMVGKSKITTWVEAADASFRTEYRAYRTSDPALKALWNTRLSLDASQRFVLYYAPIGAAAAGAAAGSYQAWSAYSSEHSDH